MKEAWHCEEPGTLACQLHTGKEAVLEAQRINIIVSMTGIRKKEGNKKFT